MSLTLELNPATATWRQLCARSRVREALAQVGYAELRLLIARIGADNDEAIELATAEVEQIAYEVEAVLPPEGVSI